MQKEFLEQIPQVENQPSSSYLQHEEAVITTAVLKQPLEASTTTAALAALECWVQTEKLHREEEACVRQGKSLCFN